MSIFKKPLLACSIAGMMSSVGIAQAAQLEEIVVTAQRKAESMQDVPIAIVAATQEQLKGAGILNVQDLAMISPSVTVADSFGYVFPFIRGIGSFVPGSTNDSSVAVYIDGVKQARLQAAALELDNIEQVEILKGPQATLYGRNATGGTLKITTKTPLPGDEFNGSVSATVGDYDHTRASFYLAGGLSDTFAASISGNYAKRDGFVKNLAPTNLDVSSIYNGVLFQGTSANFASGKDLDNLDSSYINAKLAWQPTEELLITLSSYKTESDGTASTGLRQVNPNAAQAMSILSGFPAAAFTFGGEHETYGHNNVTIFEATGSQLNINYDFDNISFKSVTAMNEVDSLNSTDLFAANFAFAGFQGMLFNEDFSQEIQISESDGEGLDWTIGGSYFKEEADDGDFVATVGIQGGFPTSSSETEYFIKSKSIFAEGYYDVTDKMSLTLGVRYTDEEAGVTPIANPVLENPAFGGTDLIGQEVTASSDATTFRVVVDYSTDWGLVYGSVSEGFKSGGIVPGTPQVGAFEPEELTSYEIGFKSTILDGRARFNGAAFLYDFTSIQALVVGGAGGGSSFVVTGDEATLSGIELDFDSQLTDRLSLQLATTILFDKEYDKFNVPALGTDTPAFFLDDIPGLEASGNDMVGASDFVALIGAQYAVPFSGGSSLTFGVNANYNSGHFLLLSNDLGSGGYQSDSSYTVVNARIAYRNAAENLEVALWAKNLTDEYYFRGGIQAVQVPAFGIPKGAIGGLEGQPKHFGVTVKYDF